MNKTHKLYCYIDETGQDTLGDFFIVAIIVTDNSQRELEKKLEAIEAATGKKTKWMKTRDKIRTDYANALANQELPAMIFIKDFVPGKPDFDELEVLATAQALSTSREIHAIREDESSAIIRLADAIAGLAREAHEGRPEYKALKAKLKRNKRFYDL
ncbi:MAG TPA: DUF3800 domain-containing protein [Patescibacteria group bacterium]|nr:DUF3800 domain-containing protein [Patescibacteria group bacterium]